MTNPVIAAAADIRQRELRRRALLDHAAKCEHDAMRLDPISDDAIELWDDARQARLAAMALEVDA